MLALTEYGDLKLRLVGYPVIYFAIEFYYKQVHIDLKALKKHSLSFK